MCFLQKNCTRINNFMYNIWQQISIYKVNTTFNAFWLCNLKLPCLVVGSSFDSYIIMSIAHLVDNIWRNLSVSCFAFLKQPSKCLQDITAKLLHDHKSSQMYSFHCFSKVSHVHCTSVAAGTQKEMVLGIQKFVSKANKFLSETSWGYGGAISPPLGSRGEVPGKLCIFKKISSWIVSKLQAKRLSQQIFEKVM